MRSKLLVLREAENDLPGINIGSNKRRECVTLGIRVNKWEGEIGTEVVRYAEIQ